MSNHDRAVVHSECKKYGFSSKSHGWVGGWCLGAHPIASKLSVSGCCMGRFLMRATGWRVGLAGCGWAQWGGSLPGKATMRGSGYKPQTE